MPIYEYECPKCNHRQDELHSMSAKPKIGCEKCGVSPCIKLVVSRISIHGTDSSRNLNYRLEAGVEKAKQERRSAEATSHMGSNPYGEQEVIEPDVVDSLED